jgi:ABC-type nitrate/sulfonate/bicarbonate transport system substrate-binding protein
VRRSALIVLAWLAAGCGAVGGTGSYGDATLSLGGKPSAEHAGIYLATQRAYDTAEGATIHVSARGDADFRVMSLAELERRRARFVGVMAIVRPDKLVLAVDRDTLQDERGLVVAVVSALERGYTQAQLEPDEAVAAMQAQVPGLDRVALSDQLDAVSPTWTAGAPYFGELPKGPLFDPAVAAKAATEP